MTQVKTLLADARLPRLEVRMLLEHVLQKPRAWLLAHDTDPLPAAAQQAYEDLARRRLAGEPMAYLVGRREFMGHALTHVLFRVARLLAHDTDPLPAAAQQAYEDLARRRLAGEPMAYLVGRREFMGHLFRVTPDVLIPRPDTEVLVETALQCLEGQSAPAVLDLGTGSGAIAISIALARRDARVMASDLSPAALAVAAGNAWELAASVRFVEGSWFDAVPAGEGFELIVSNPPYVASDDPHLQQGDVRFEPRGADRRRRRAGRPGPHRAGRRRAARRAARCGWSTAGTRPRRCAGCSRRPASRTWQAAATWPASSAFPAAAGRAGAGSGAASRLGAAAPLSAAGAFFSILPMFRA